MANTPNSTAHPPARSHRVSEATLHAECGRLLVTRGHITRGRLDDATARATLLGKGLDEVLLAEHWVTECQLLETLSEVSGIPHGTLADFSLSPELAARAPITAALTYRIIPVAATQDTLTVATTRLHEVTEHDSLQTLLRTRVNWVLCPRRDIDEAIKHF